MSFDLGRRQFFFFVWGPDPRIFVVKGIDVRHRMLE
jgi:hypothetical protein